MRIALLFPLLWLASVCSGAGQEPIQSLNERLGFPPEARLLIVHNDDAGVAHAVNTATFEALESGLVTSTSIMAPCPWLHEIVAYAEKNPDADMGVHLTLTCEWDNFRWGPVAGKSVVPSLVGPHGNLKKLENAITSIDAKQAEMEMREQVKLIRSAGIEPTHIDAHQFIVLFRPDLFDSYLKIGRETGIPVLLSSSLFPWIRAWIGDSVPAPDWESYLQPDDILLDNIITLTPGQEEAGWPSFYEKAVRSLQPGVSELIVHVGIAGDEMQGIAGELDWGSSWRQKELDYLTSEEFRELLKEEDVQLIGWKEIAGLYRSKLNTGKSRDSEM